MITRKTKKLVYNIVVIALLVIGMAYVCSRFIHLGNVEYTPSIREYRVSSRRFISMNTSLYTRATRCS